MSGSPTRKRRRLNVEEPKENQSQPSTSSTNDKDFQESCLPSKTKHLASSNELLSMQSMRERNENATQYNSPSTSKQLPSTVNVQPGPSNENIGEEDRQIRDEPVKPDDCFRIIQTHVKEVKKFNSEEIFYNLSFIDEKIHEYTEDVKDVFLVVHNIFESLIASMIRDFEPQDRVRIEIHARGSLDRPIWVPLTQVEDLDVNRIQTAIEKVQQSNQSIKLEGILEINICRIKMISGNGITSDEIRQQREKILKKKRSILQIDSENLCLARALVTARARIEMYCDPKSRSEKSTSWERIRKGLKEQEKLAKELHKAAEIKEGPCGLEEVQQFQNTVLKNYQIIVVKFENHKYLYIGPRKEEKLFILYYDNHFDVITTMSGFLETSYFCNFCLKGFKTWEHHRCNNVCLKCFNSHKDDCPPGTSSPFCNVCGRTFHSERCKRNHENVPKALAGGKTKKTICGRVQHCKPCGKTVKDQHKCGESFCYLCKSSKKNGHKCYMQKIKGRPTTRSEESRLFIFFDFECRQDEEDIIPTGENASKYATTKMYRHIPNFCVAQRVCGGCLTLPDFAQHGECSACKREEKTFKGEDTVSKFCDWLLSDNNWGATAVAHNMKGYDGHFVLSHLIRIGRCPNVIMNGNKIMSLEVKEKKSRQKIQTIKLLDSYNFLPMRLSEFAETFDIQHIQKGYFPHMFNTPENENYVGSLPDKKYYCPDEMSPAERKKFLKWYSEQPTDGFKFQDEIFSYCKKDVDLLRVGCGKFRELMQEIADEDPFENCITIASVALRVYRKKFMEVDRIAQIKTSGPDKQSKLAMKWIRWMEQKDRCKIQHAYSLGEKKIGQYRVDGFCAETKKVYEFHGCYWHGCQNCYESTSSGPGSFETMGDALQSCTNRANYIRSLGYEVVEKWECEFLSEVKSDCHLSADSLKYFNSYDMPLNPREAFYGGRTNATKLYQKADGSDQIMYFDVCSLYPWVNKYGKYPIGHPEIIREDLAVDKLDTYEGLIKCKVIPPMDLFHPVLPYRYKGKLLFPLCRTCAEKSASTCTHTSATERELHGTWVTDEMKKAVKMGYEISQIQEVWHFEKTSQYSAQTEDEGLFSEYVNKFLKLKQESDGWPSECKDDHAKNRYIQEYREKEGIFLDKEKIKVNPGRRALAKLMLNSLWGKFGQRNDHIQTQYVTEIETLNSLVIDKKKEIVDISFTDNDETAEVRWKIAEDFVEGSPNTNVFIAAYTTAQARLKLYDYLEKLGRRILYFDTDSIIFIWKEGEWNPPTGRYLGDMTNELEKKYGVGSFIEEFASAGPKNYAYKVKIPSKDEAEYACKVKGFSLNHSTASVINFDKIKETVLAQCSSANANKTVVRQTTFKRQKSDIYTKKGYKTYRFLYDKRVLLKDFTTLPYGYQVSQGQQKI